MRFWGHYFRSHGSAERICMACGYVVDGSANEEDVRRWIQREEGCELHCGGYWHVFSRRPTSSLVANNRNGA